MAAKIPRRQALREARRNLSAANALIAELETDPAEFLGDSHMPLQAAIDDAYLDRAECRAALAALTAADNATGGITWN
jgi:hypothetical protein